MNGLDEPPDRRVNGILSLLLTSNLLCVRAGEDSAFDVDCTAALPVDAVHPKARHVCFRSYLPSACISGCNKRHRHCQRKTDS